MQIKKRILPRPNMILQSKLTNQTKMKRNPNNKAIVIGTHLNWFYLELPNPQLLCSGKERNLNIVELLCANCSRWFHESCIGYQLGKLVPFLSNYVFVCKNCSSTGLESFKKTQARMFTLHLFLRSYERLLNFRNTSDVYHCFSKLAAG